MKHIKSYNKSIRDKMEPKSDEEVQAGIDQYLAHLKDLKDNPEKYENEDVVDTFINILIQITDVGEVIKKIIDDGTVDMVELLYAIISPGLGFNQTYLKRNQNNLLDRLYEIIVENKEKLTELNQ